MANIADQVGSDKEARLRVQLYSVIIATRDRPELLARALRSVAAQRLQNYELLLVDDSSSAEMRSRNAAALAECVPGGVIIETDLSEGGIGPGEARNRGMERASRPYFAFLDDDDEWIDPEYLSRAAELLERLGLDLLFADQMAVRSDGSVVEQVVWSEDLAEKLPAAGAIATDGAYVLRADQVLLSDGFAHLNTTLIRRSLAWDRLGGFDAAIRYEEDRDFYLRAIDVAAAVGYTPLVVARHHVPTARASASSIATEQRHACRLAVLNKAVERSARPAVRARGRRDRSNTLRCMSAREAEAGRLGLAIRHGRAALGDRFSAKWALFVAGLYARKAFSNRVQVE